MNRSLQTLQLLNEFELKAYQELFRNCLHMQEFLYINVNFLQVNYEFSP